MKQRRRSFLATPIRYLTAFKWQLASTFLLLSPVCTAAHAQSAAPLTGGGPIIRQPFEPNSKVDAASVRELYGKLPMAFEKNQGQAGEGIDFIARGAGYRVRLKSTEVIVDLMPHSGQPAVPGAIRMRFVGARPDAIVSSISPLPGKTNYFKGTNVSTHLTGIENFSRVSYAAIYPGIDIVYYGNQQHLEYDLAVSPGADLSKIRIAFEGPDRIEIDQVGNLQLNLGDETIQFQKPIIYQLIEGKKKIIDGRYIRLTEKEFGFEVASYDKSAPLIVDPVLNYSTYLGGSSDDVGTAVAVDAAGNAYLAGYTYSSNFPILNAYDRSLGRGDEDAFIAKLNPTGSALIYSTYLGATKSLDIATDIAVDAAGNAYVTGMTNGNDFPVTAGAYQTGIASGGTFVTKLNAAGNSLVYSTYILGVMAPRIATDTAGHVYLTGSATPGFSTTIGALQGASANPDSTNAFVAKLNPTGTTMAYATFIGGSGTDTGKGIAVDEQGNAYVAGYTTSNNFPTAYALQAAHQGGWDGFIAKLNPSGTALAYSTYLGGAQNDTVSAIAIDAQGSAYLTGETYSADFPIRNAFQPTKAGYRLVNADLGSAFVTKLAPTGDVLVFSSFIGGEICTGYCQALLAGSNFPGDVAYDIAVDAAGHAYITGLARSYTFPLIDSLLPSKQDNSEESLFVTKVSLTGSALLYSTFVRTGNIAYGGSLQTGVPYGAGNAIAVDSVGNAHVTSEHDSRGGLLITTGSLQTVSKGGEDAVAFKLGATSLNMALTSSANPASSQTTTTLTATVSDPNLTGNVIFMDGATKLGSAPLSNGTATLAITLPPGVRRLAAVMRSSSTTADSPLLYQVVNTGLACN